MRSEIFLFIALLIIALISFLGIISETNKQFSFETPAYGGFLKEGVIGAPRFINPILAQTDADRDLVSLMYTGLLRYDETGVPQPALAEKYEISKDGLEYKITLKNKLYWSDGEKLTADDIIFTIGLAKNPQLLSPRRASWEGVEVEKQDDNTILFTLKKAYAPFLENLTLGIIPRHIWEQVPISQFPLVELNINPVGDGPYKLKSVSRDSIGSVNSAILEANEYFVLGRPNIKNIEVKFYRNEENIATDLKNGTIDSAGGLSPKYTADLIKTLGQTINIKSINLQRIIAVFLNQSSKQDFGSINVRRALDMAVDKKTLVDNILDGYGETIAGPLPKSIFANNTSGAPSFDINTAKKLLSKQKSPLSFTLTTAETPELVAAAQMLKDMWSKAGVNVDIKTFNLSDLEQLVIGPRRYEAFLYGEEVVGQTPDPFAFWHSSQRAHPGYNIALYANTKVDNLLENVRSVQNSEERIKIYADIQTEIIKDMPAVFLFSPSYIYAVPSNLGGIDIKNINTGSERFSAVYKWYLEKHYVWNIFK
ncbi:MAG: ABC transporter substrate-binding protein [bacterium]|nr:ABC transporter substrate-binding protein [bacterium]